MTLGKLRELAMQHSLSLGLAVKAKLPEERARTLYFQHETTRDDFIRRIKKAGGVVEVVTVEP